MAAKRAYVWVAGVTLVAVAAIAVGAVMLFRSEWFRMENRPAPDESPTTVWSEDASGVDGIGDPYTPEAGGTGYQVTHYDISVEVDPVSHFIWGTTVLTVEALGPLEELHLDLAQSVTTVTFDGGDVDFTHNGLDLRLTLPQPATPYQEYRVSVEYNGELEDMPYGLDQGVYLRVGEVLIAEEPHSCAVWFPCNDHPSDPATYSIKATVPHDVEAISAGTWVDTQYGESWDLWIYAIDAPTVTYAVPLAVGQYTIDKDTVEIGGKSVQYFAAASDNGASFGSDGTEGALAYLRRSIAAADHLTTYLGEYPPNTLGGILPPMSTSWGALETWGRPVYDPSCARDGGWDEVLAHEISHFWFGDTITLAGWHDIVINEGMATYMEEYLAPGMTKAAADAWFYEQIADTSPGFWAAPLSDPGPDPATFSGHVYDGGAMAIHATRQLMGDDAFFEFLRAWAAQTGPHSLDEWRTMAQDYSPVDLAYAHAIWFDGTTRLTCSPEVGCP
ncbi:MAG: hypothetical protein LBM94_03185 [Propionibacteriaceae bacterium]|jgi:aminopeptidase N|nr:hypothetical protein [Propionibacteriaceae bacterium]